MDTFEKVRTEVKMARLLDALVRERRAQALSYQEHLKRIVELAGQVQNPGRGTAYPEAIDTPARQALYENLDRDETLAVALDEDIRATKKDDWRGNKFKEREVRYVIRRHLKNDADVERIFELVRNQGEY